MDKATRSLTYHAMLICIFTELYNVCLQDMTRHLDENVESLRADVKQVEDALGDVGEIIAQHRASTIVNEEFLM